MHGSVDGTRGGVGGEREAKPRAQRVKLREGRVRDLHTAVRVRVRVRVNLREGRVRDLHTASVSGL